MSDEPRPSGSGAGAAASRWRGRLLALTVGSAASLVGLELVIDRWFHVRSQMYVEHPTYLHDALPNARRIQPMEPSRLREGDVARVFVSTGDEGFRGGSLDDSRSAPRVLVLGDSFVMAENVPAKRTFARVLATELAERIDGTARVETVNAGRSGYGPDQSLLQLEARFDEIAPDAVVHVICAHNDFGDPMRNKLFRVADDGTLRRERPVLGDRVIRRFDESRARASELALVRLWRFWRDVEGTRIPVDTLPDSAFDNYLLALREQYLEHVVGRRNDVVSIFEDVYDADVALHPASESAKAKVALMRLILAREVELCAERDVPLVFVVVPSAIDVDSTFGARVPEGRFPDYDPGRLASAFVDAIAAAGGTALDMTPVIAPGGDGAGHFVGGTDMHWNAIGQRLCAEAVAAALAADEGVAGRLRAR